MKKRDYPRDTPFWSFMTLVVIDGVAVGVVAGLKKLITKPSVAPRSPPPTA